MLEPLLPQLTYYCLLLSLAVCSDPMSSSYFNTSEFCDWEEFRVTCPEDNDVIIIRSASYGRMGVGRCVTENYGNIGCSTDVTSSLNRKCTGRRNCEVSVISLHPHRTCPKDFTSYLEVQYRCISVSKVWCKKISNNFGLKNQEVIVLKENSPQIVSKSLFQQHGNAFSGVQSSPEVFLLSKSFPSGCTWIFKTPHEHQRIQVSVVNLEMNSQVRSTHAEGKCLKRYVTVGEHDDDDVELTVLCGDDLERDEKVMFVTRGSAVHVTQVDSSFLFLLRLKVLGCPGLNSLLGADVWVKSTSFQLVTLSCNSTNHTWSLKCHGNQWKGRMENCSKIYSSALESEAAFVVDMIIVLSVVCLGVAIGVGLGLITLATTLRYLNSDNRKISGQNSSDQEASNLFCTEHDTNKLIFPSHPASPALHGGPATGALTEECLEMKLSEATRSSFPAPKHQTTSLMYDPTNFQDQSNEEIKNFRRFKSLISIIEKQKWKNNRQTKHTTKVECSSLDLTLNFSPEVINPPLKGKTLPAADAGLLSVTDSGAYCSLCREIGYKRCLEALPGYVRVLPQEGKCTNPNNCHLCQTNSAKREAFSTDVCRFCSTFECTGVPQEQLVPIGAEKF